MPKPRQDWFVCDICKEPGCVDAGIGDLAEMVTICYRCFHNKYPDHPNYYFTLLGNPLGDQDVRQPIYVQISERPGKTRDAAPATAPCPKHIGAERHERRTVTAIGAALIFPAIFIIIVILFVQLLHKPAIHGILDRRLEAVDQNNYLSEIGHTAKLKIPLFSTANQEREPLFEANHCKDYRFGVRAWWMKMPANSEGEDELCFPDKNQGGCYSRQRPRFNM